MKINWEYDIPKLRGILTAIIVILGVIMIAFEWKKADFLFRILLGLTMGVDAVRSWMEKHRFIAILGLCLMVICFVLAGHSYFRYNV